jgi:hypothetical protein
MSRRDPWIVQHATPRQKLTSISHRHLSKQVQRMLLHASEHGSSITKAAKHTSEHGSSTTKADCHLHGLASVDDSRDRAISVTRFGPQSTTRLPDVIRSIASRVLLSRSAWPLACCEEILETKVTRQRWSGCCEEGTSEPSSPIVAWACALRRRKMVGRRGDWDGPTDWRREGRLELDC